MNRPTAPSTSPAETRAAIAPGEGTPSVPAKAQRILGPAGLPLLIAALFLVGWHASVRVSGSEIFPTPSEVARGIVELIQKGLLLKYVVASLFRVTWGFTLAALIGVPFGLLLGWYGW